MARQNLDDLRRARKAAADTMAAVAARIGALEAAETPDAAALEAETAAFAAAEAAFAKADAAVTRAAAVEAAQAAAAQGDGAGAGSGTGAAGADAVPAIAADPAHRGVAAGFMVQALARTKGDRDKAARLLEAEGHGAISAALSGASEGAGGVTIPRPQAAELIEMLRARVVVRASGARTLPMPAGEMRHAKQMGSAVAAYAAENAAIAPSQPSFDKIDQSFKKLVGMVPIGNSLLRHSGVAMAQLVRDDLLKVMALREDLAFLRGDGSADTPKGLRHWMLPANWTAAPVAATPAAAEAAIRRAVSLVEDADVGMVSPGWIMRASTKNWLASLKDANGNPLFPSIGASAQLMGFPIRTSSQIPDNLGAGGDETEIYFGDFDEAMIGDSMALVVGSSTDASFVDGNGATVSAFQNDLTLMRAISEHDFAPAHDEAFAGFNASGWTL
ncbi:HK97 family phage major capsid protein [Cereibacter johrii]|uniref:HK97 family phage major capsid protein n=2 Tax=Cereibacter johrii TaxID=445629 RepID=A0ABX5J420_9RHOB|nr:phage major capsid protein [Cereibacter johrii]PTM74774.1 HK97 family phage major capsid protein [Cereibacter johrii]